MIFFLFEFTWITFFFFCLVQIIDIFAINFRIKKVQALNYPIVDDGNIIFDTNNNGLYDDNWRSDGIDNDEDGVIDENDEADFIMNYGGLPKLRYDANDDGIDDYPDFDVKNVRYDLRLDWEPNSDVTASLSHGYAWARNINITGIARYLEAINITTI